MMIVKLISLITAVIVGTPVGGVYASADSPSKYLDRLTSANGSSEVVEDEVPATVSKAVMSAHGVILNTVDRNADRLEFVDPSESRETDGGAPGPDGVETDARTRVDSPEVIMTSDSDSNGVNAQSLDWPEEGFTGESTVTYDANGHGEFPGGSTMNQVTTRYDGYREVTKYAHSDNVDNAGVQSGGYKSRRSYSRIVRIPGASSLSVKLTYQIKSRHDWVCAFTGAEVGDPQCATSLTGKLSNNFKKIKKFTVPDDTVTFLFSSNEVSSNNYYGFYAIITGLGIDNDPVIGSYQVPIDLSDDYVFVGWNTKPDGSGENFGNYEAFSQSDLTVFAQWRENNWNKWGTIGWKITHDGALKIRPWEGDNGVTGSSTFYNDAPWYPYRDQIKRIESVGNIVLNEKSNYLFYDCANLVSLQGLSEWDTSNVTNMIAMFASCSSLETLEGLQNWNVTNVRYVSSRESDGNYHYFIEGLFKNCVNLKNVSALEKWNLESVTSLAGLFYNCSKLNDISSLKHWNVSNIRYLGWQGANSSGIFEKCTSLEDISALSSWKTGALTDMSQMLRGSAVTTLKPLENWDVSNVEMMGSSFASCDNLITLDGVEKWDTSKVTRLNWSQSCSYSCAIASYSGGLFSESKNLTDASALKNWNFNSLINGGEALNMLVGCSSLEKIGIPSLSNGGLKLISQSWHSMFNKSDALYFTKFVSENGEIGPFAEDIKDNNTINWKSLIEEMKIHPDLFQQGIVYVKCIDSWLVKLDGNGGLGSMDINFVKINDVFTIPNNQYLRFGYEFTGWTTQPNPVSDANPLLKPGETYKPSDAANGKKYTLYAQWEKLSDTDDQPVTGQSGSLPGWVQVNSSNTRNEIAPNQSQSVSFTNKYDQKSTSVQFKFTKLMDGNVPNAGKSFQFELIDVMENKVIQTTTNTGASVQFQPITYDKPGEYTYYVRESVSNDSMDVNDDPDLDYDDHVVEVIVTVTEEEDSSAPNGVRLKALAQITGDTTFRNDSKPASLEISKSVTGVVDGMNPSHEDREFQFRVSLLDQDNNHVTGKTYPVTTINSNDVEDENQTTPDSLTFDDTGNAIIGLKAGDRIRVHGIPAYYKYTVTEINIPSGYENTSLTNPNGVLGANSTVSVDAVNHYTVQSVNVTLQAGKLLLAPGGFNQSVGNGEFQFSLCEVNDLAVPSNANAFKSEGQLSCTGVSETFNDGNGLVTFPELTYDTPGVYEYQLREVKGNELDITYDPVVYKVKVDVADDGDGRLVTRVTYTNQSTGDSFTPASAGDKPVWNSSNASSMGIPVFVNRSTMANRLPVMGERDIIMAGVVLALILAGGLFVFLKRNEEE